MILDLVKLSARNLTRRGKRSWLTIIGIVIGITAIVTLFSLAQGLEASVTQEFEGLGVNTIYILPGSGIQGFVQSEVEEGMALDDSDLEAVRRARGVEEAGPMIYDVSTLGNFQGERQRVPLVGIPTDSSQEMIMRTNQLEIERGRDLRTSDKRSGIAGYNLWRGNTFEKAAGLRSKVKVEDQDIRIIGTMKQSGDPEYDRSVYVALETARDILGVEDRIDYIMAESQSGISPEETSDNIEEEIRQERNVAEGEEGFTVSTADDLMESFLGILGTVQYVVLGIVSIALFVGGLGIMNTMYMSVSERTKEIGVMKSMGATKKQILSVYLAESGILGLIGGTIGIVVGLGLSEIAFYIIRQYMSIPLQPARPPTLILGALVGSFVFGMIAGFLPARKAADLEPVEAMRRE